MANPDYHIDNLPGAQFRAELNDTLTDIKNNKSDKAPTDSAIADLQTNRLEKTVTAADSAKLGGLTPDGYARKIHSHTADDLPNGTTTAPGILQLLDSVTSTSTTYAATANSVKSAYDKGQSAYTLAQTAKTTADAAYPKAGGDLNGTINYTPDTGNVITLDNKTVLYRHTAAGAISFGADEAVAIGSGEARALTAKNVPMTVEELHLSSDQRVIVRTNLQGGGQADRNLSLKRMEGLVLRMRPRRGIIWMFMGSRKFMQKVKHTIKGRSITKFQLLATHYYRAFALTDSCKNC